MIIRHGLPDQLDSDEVPVVTAQCISFQTWNDKCDGKQHEEMHKIDMAPIFFRVCSNGETLKPGQHIDPVGND